MTGFLFFDDLRLLPLLLPGLLLSLTLHEFAHARVALLFGDPTAFRAGRCTLNPLAHLDPVGTFMILMVGFGWAKPVPVNPYLLRPPRLGDIMVAIAGPLSNIILAAICFLIVSLLWKAHGSGYDDGDGLMYLIQEALILTGVINVGLLLFNLVPLYPLDGHHVLAKMLPSRYHDGFMRWQIQYGRWVLIALWIGPGLMHRLGMTDVPDPLGLYIGWASRHVIGFLHNYVM